MMSVPRWALCCQTWRRCLKQWAARSRDRTSSWTRSAAKRTLPASTSIGLSKSFKLMVQEIYFSSSPGRTRGRRNWSTTDPEVVVQMYTRATAVIMWEQLQLSLTLVERFQNLLEGILRRTMVVKCLHVETIVPLKDLNAFKQKCFRYSIFLQTIFLMYNFIFIDEELYPTNVSDPVFCHFHE